MDENLTHNKPKRKYKKFYQKPEWLIPIIVGFILWIISFNDIPNTNSIVNSTNVAIVEDSPDTIVTQISGKIGNPCQDYNQIFTLKNLAFKRFGFTIDLYNVKFILNNNQEAFIKNYVANKIFKIACCNDEATDCYINYEYQIPKKYKICFVTVFFGDEGNKIYLGPDFDQNCYKVVNGSIEEGSHKFNELSYYTEFHNP